MPTFDDFVQFRQELLYKYQYEAKNDGERNAIAIELGRNQSDLCQNLTIKSFKYNDLHKYNYLQQWFGKDPFHIPEATSGTFKNDIEEFNFLNKQREALVKKIRLSTFKALPYAEKFNTLKAFQENTKSLGSHLKSEEELTNNLLQLKQKKAPKEKIDEADAKLRNLPRKVAQLKTSLSTKISLSFKEPTTYLDYLKSINTKEKNSKTRGKLQAAMNQANDNLPLEKMEPSKTVKSNNREEPETVQHFNSKNDFKELIAERQQLLSERAINKEPEKIIAITAALTTNEFAIMQDILKDNQNNNKDAFNQKMVIFRKVEDLEPLEAAELQKLDTTSQSTQKEGGPSAKSRQSESEPRRSSTTLHLSERQKSAGKGLLSGLRNSLNSRRDRKSSSEEHRP